THISDPGPVRQLRAPRSGSPGPRGQQPKRRLRTPGKSQASWGGAPTFKATTTTRKAEGTKLPTTGKILGGLIALSATLGAIGGSAAASPRGVTIVSVTSPVHAGAYASLVAQTAPHANCELSVRLSSGRESESTGLGMGPANASGQVSWKWLTGTRTTPG